MAKSALFWFFGKIFVNILIIWVNPRRDGAGLGVHGIRVNNDKGRNIEALVAERMKPKVNAAIPDIQIGGKAGHSSIEHLVLIKTWMLDMAFSRALIWKNSLIKRVSLTP